MAIAGKVAITPKGAWSSTVSYEKLDAVTHNNAVYIAKKDSKGVEPVDGEYWMLSSVGLDQEQLDQLKAELDDNNMLGWVVPEEMPIKNYVDSDGVFHQRVDRVDLGTLDWILDSSSGEFYTTGVKDIIKVPSSNNVAGNVYMYGYKNVSRYSTATNDKVVSCSVHGSIVINDTSYEDSTALNFKNAMQGKYVYYELAEEITTSVDGNEAVTKIQSDVSDLKASVDDLYSKPGLYELLSETTLDLRSETSQSFVLPDNPNIYDLIYAEFRGPGSGAAYLYDSFIGRSYNFSILNNYIDIYCNGTKYTLGVSFNSSTNTLTLSNSDARLHLTIIIRGIKISSLVLQGGGEVENPGLS